MKKRISALFVLLLTLSLLVRADEGMWVPLFLERLNYADMQQKGLKLTPEEIYSINNSSLKDAIIIFGRGCTGEVVSPDGLVFTNHHCGYGQIQAHSTVENDYLTHGFWAMNREEELPNPGLTATFLIRIEEVTDRFVPFLNDEMSEEERNKEIRRISKAITDEATAGTHYEASVRTFFGGDEFYLFVYEVFKDVRLVGAPPSSIGKFGGDTDNWMWPRHTGDFAVFRIYTGPDGKPAEYSKENIPLKPRYYLPISLDGYENGDFAMILGYPGSTDRYRSSWGVALAIEKSNPAIVAIRDKKLAVMRTYMDASEAVKIQYASKYAGVSNYWKYYIGQTRGLKRLKVVDKKRSEEALFTQWVHENPVRAQKYGQVLDWRKEATDLQRQIIIPQIYLQEAIYRGSEIIGFARRFSKLEELLSAKTPNQQAINEEIEKLRDQIPGFFKNYHAPLDQKLLGEMLEMYYRDVPPAYHPPLLKQIFRKYKGDFQAYARWVFSKSHFTTPDKVQQLLHKPTTKSLQSDPVVSLYKAFDQILEQLSPTQQKINELASKGNRLYIRGLREMYGDSRKFYPDANFTMRLTYGTVADYYPADAIHYNYYTTLTGVMEKEDPSNEEFIVPEKLKELYQNQDFGDYHQNGRMIVGFITNTDITGGNSGSPVLNSRGELIGIAFDGNWEAMSGDIAFEPDLQRTISVDIRYVLFIIDKYAGARHLIDELTIIRRKP